MSEQQQTDSQITAAPTIPQAAAAPVKSPAASFLSGSTSVPVWLLVMLLGGGGALGFGVEKVGGLSSEPTVTQIEFSQLQTRVDTLEKDLEELEQDLEDTQRDLSIKLNTINTNQIIMCQALEADCQRL